MPDSHPTTHTHTRTHTRQTKNITRTTKIKSYHVRSLTKREEAVRIVDAIGRDRVFNGQHMRVMDDDEFNHMDSY